MNDRVGQNYIHNYILKWLPGSDHGKSQCMGGGGGQMGVWVSFGHPIADFGHPNIYSFCV